MDADAQSVAGAANGLAPSLRTWAPILAFAPKSRRLVGERKQRLDAPLWFAQTHPDAPLNCVAYFSMEWVSARRGRFTPVAWAMWMATSSSGPTTWVRRRFRVGPLYQQRYVPSRLRSCSRRCVPRAPLHPVPFGEALADRGVYRRHSRAPNRSQWFDDALGVVGKVDSELARRLGELLRFG